MPSPQEAFSYADMEIALAVDKAMKDDLNDDGYVEYYEFSLSQKLTRSVDPHLAQGVGTKAEIDAAFDEEINGRATTNVDTGTHSDPKPGMPPSWNNVEIDPQDDLIRDLNNVVTRGSRPSAGGVESSNQVKPPGWTPDFDDNGADDNQFPDPVENIRRHQTQSRDRQQALTEARQDNSNNENRGIP